MSAHRENYEEQLAASTPLVVDDAATLTVEQLSNFRIIVINDASGIALTLPPASAALAGMVRFIGNKGAGASTLVVAAGYGGGADTITLAQGDGAVVFCDGTYWYNVNIATAT